MNGKAFFFFLLAALVLFKIMYMGPMYSHAITLSAPSPAFSWQALDGSKHALKELSGRPVVLHFWASWCGPCREEFPKILRAAEANKEITFLAVSGDEDGDKARRFIRDVERDANMKAPANMLFASDSHQKLIFETFQTSVYPETILLDNTHHMRRKFPGPVQWDDADVHDALKQLSAH